MKFKHGNHTIRCVNPEYLNLRPEQRKLCDQPKTVYFRRMTIECMDCPVFFRIIEKIMNDQRITVGELTLEPEPFDNE